MKTFLISILILLALIAGFSTIDGRIEYVYPFGNWVVSGTSGAPTPIEGKPGKGELRESEHGKAYKFSLGTSEDEENQGGNAKSQESSTAQEYSPITVEVVTEQKIESHNLEPINQVLYRIAIVLHLVCIVSGVFAIVEIVKCKNTIGDLL